MENQDFQQMICQLEGELRVHQEREEGLQRRLGEATLELRDSKTWVADLQQMLEKGRQDLIISRVQCEKKQEQLICANHELKTSKTEHARTAAKLDSTREELQAVRNQLEIAIRDLGDNRKEKESLEVRLTVTACMSVCKD